MANRELLGIIRAARAGEGSAQLALGRHYLFGGKGLPQNFATALHWLDRAARQDIAEAWQLIGERIPFDIAQRAVNMTHIAEWYERAFDDGVMQAGLVLAQLVLASGTHAAAPALHGKALSALAAAAGAGIMDARRLLAQLHDGREQHDRTPARHAAQANASATITAADPAREALAERAWAIADYATFLRWSLPVARDLVRRSTAAAG